MALNGNEVVKNKKQRKLFKKGNIKKEKSVKWRIPLYNSETNGIVRVIVNQS